MLNTTLPLIPFSHTTLPKKQWVDNNQEKKGRVISVAAVRQSMIENQSESDTDSDVASIDTREYMSENSWNSDEEYDESEQAGLLEHIDTLLPDKAEVGKPQPKIIKEKPPEKNKEKAPGFFGRQWIYFLAWKEREKQKRMHYLFRDYQKRITEYEVQLQKDIELEIESIKKEVMKAAFELKKRIKINSMAAKSKESGVERFEVGIAVRNEEARKMAFFCANLQRWATEKHDHKIEQAMLDKAYALEKAKIDKEKQDKIDAIEAQRVEDLELGIDTGITQKIAEFGRTAGVIAGTNVYDPVDAALQLSIKNKRKGRGNPDDDIQEVDKNPVLQLRLLENIDFKKLKRGGVTVDGQKMPIFDHPDLVKTRHVEELKCNYIGERGALALAAEFVRGACPMIQLLDLSRNQIQTRGLGRLLHGMKLANLMSLKRLVLVSNDLTARSIEYLRDAFQGGTFPALEILDLRDNELGDAGIDVIIRSFHSMHFEYLQELHLANNKISDVGFGKLMRTIQSLQQTNMPYLTRLSIEGNGVTGKAKREFYPLPSYLSC